MSSQPSSRFKPRNDPITFEVLRHRLWQINDEQGKTIVNVSGSPVATEGNDFNVALLNSDGEVVTVGPYIIAHVSAISVIVQSAISLLGSNNIHEGDMYLTNDPWMGAAHQNDVCVIQPVFWDGQCFAWTASVIHQVDVGGPRPGSWNPLARSVFDEAPRYRMLRVVRDGTVQPEVVATYLTNSRLPDLIELDLRAQIACANVSRARLYELVTRYGLETIKNALEDNLDYSELLFRKKLAELPDGEAYGEDHMDHDGLSEELYTVRCRAQKKGERILLDFCGTSPQAPGFINTAYAGALAGAFSALFPYLCPDIPWNAGVLRLVDTRIEEGTVHNARFPAPVGFGVVHATHCTTNATALALGKLLAASERHHADAMAGWSGSPFVYNIFGTDDQNQPFATMLLSSDVQGCGARAFGDGFDVGGKLTAPQANVANIESIEGSYPLLYLYRRRTRDSGGAGEWRGGVSAEVAFTVHHASEMDITPNTWGVSLSATGGLLGGYPGGGAAVLLKRDTDIAQQWRSDALPQSFEQLNGAALEILPAKCSFTMKPGDIFGSVPHGGGGIGDPIRRNPERVAADVRQRLVSAEWANRIYGTVLDGNCALDYEATKLLRQRIRRQRIEEGRSRLPLPPGAGEQLSGELISPYGALYESKGWLFCGDCLKSLAPADEPVKSYLLRTRRPLASAGPWIGLRKGKDRLDFEIWEYACPHCGALISVEQRHRQDDEDLQDFIRYGKSHVVARPATSAG
jgi:N-methylhydantoinase B